MQFKALFQVAVAVSTLVVVYGESVATQQQWYCPLVATAAGIHPSAEASEKILHNEFLRLVHEDFTMGMLCAPYYYTIEAQPELIYYDANNTEHRSDQELQCTINYVEMGRELEVQHCIDSEVYAVQFGHVEANSNHSFVLAELCYHNETENLIFGKSRLTRITTNTVADADVAYQQLPIQEVSLRQHRADDIGHNEIGDLSSVQEAVDAMFQRIEYDALWTSDPAIRSYDAWERYIWNAHALGLEYLTIDALKFGAPLEAVVANLTARVRHQPGPVDLYTGYIGEIEVHGKSSGKVSKVPKYVWFVAMQSGGDGRKAIAYIVPNGEHSVERDLCENQCKDVYCCYVNAFAIHARRLQSVFEPIAELL